MPPLKAPPSTWTANPSYSEAFGSSRYCKPLPTYVVDLRLPPSQRWLLLPSVVDVPYCLSSARAYVDEVSTGGLGFPVATTGNSFVVLLRSLLFGFFRLLSFFSRYRADLDALSSVFSVSVGEIFLANILYEILGGCTSIVCLDASSDRLLHGRTMDWPAPHLAASTVHFVWLDPVTGLRAFESVGWPGYAGVLTGLKPGCFSISLNARYPASSPPPYLLTALFPSLSESQKDFVAYLSGSLRRLSSALSGGWQAGSVIRHALESSGSYEEAVKTAFDTRLCVPSYFTIAGTSKACIITHGTTLAERGLEELQCGKDALRPFLIQTNDDNEVIEKEMEEESNAPADFFSKERYCAVCDALEEEPSLSVRGLGYLLTNTLKNGGVRMGITLYSCIMMPAELDEGKAFIACRMSRMIGDK